MNCKEYQQQAIEIAFGEAERTGEFDRHLESCQACRAEFAAYAFAAQGIEDVPAPPTPSLSNERLYSAIRAQNIRRSSPWLPRLAFAGIAASLALAAWIGFNRPSIDSPPPYVASADEKLDSVPSGPIVIPESAPKIRGSEQPELAVAQTQNSAGPVFEPKPRRRSVTPAVVEEVPEELLTVVIGGAEGALDYEPTGHILSDVGAAMMEPAPQVSSAKTDSPIVVIQPQGNATEKSSNDVSIGG